MFIRSLLNFRMINHLSKIFTLLILFLSLDVLSEAKHHTLEDLLQYKCNNNNQTACEQLAQLQEEKEQAAFLDQRVKVFSHALEKKQLMLDSKRPNLEAAYPIVMEDYFQGLHHAGKLESLVPENKLAECAGHYHNYWINKKLWWPNDDGKPDWESIYVFIVDHYYGFCLKTL